jgi:hypothetical protein
MLRYAMLESKRSKEEIRIGGGFTAFLLRRVVGNDLAGAARIGTAGQRFFGHVVESKAYRLGKFFFGLVENIT